MHRHQGLSRLDTGFGGGFCCQALVELLGTDDATGLQSSGAIRVGLGFCGHRLGFIHGCLGLVDFSQHVVSGKHRQHLTSLDLVAHVDPHLCEAQTANFRTNACLLPSGYGAVGADALR